MVKYTADCEGTDIERYYPLLRRTLLAALLVLLAIPDLFMTAATAQQSRVATGARVLVDSGFARLDGQRVGLITNQTGKVEGHHLVDHLANAPNVKLTAIFAPEHGFRGTAEAGAAVRDGVDPQTGVTVFSLYGATKKPTRKMLRNVDVLVFDIQDIGVRFYTYISTMGLAMQAAAEAGIPFIVLDRPNPLGGDYISGFVLEPSQRSFVGQYPIPTVHGLTVGELARMIKGEAWLPGLENLDLSIIHMGGWQRTMRWPDTGLEWIATSPNIPSFEIACLYAGTGLTEQTSLNEGRGTSSPFAVFGAPWLNAKKLAADLQAQGIEGVRFDPHTYTPRSIPGVAANPRYKGRRIPGVKITITNQARVKPHELGMHALSQIFAQARAKRVSKIFDTKRMFDLLAGTPRLRAMLSGGKSAATVIASWRSEVAKFEKQRTPYLIY